MSENKNSCNSDLACDTLNSFLESFAPILASEAYKQSYAKMDISTVETKYEDVLKIIFSKIADTIEKGEFTVTLTQEDFTSDHKTIPSFKWGSLKIKKYLESLGYGVFHHSSSSRKKSIEDTIYYHIMWEI